MAGKPKFLFLQLLCCILCEAAAGTTSTAVALCMTWRHALSTNLGNLWLCSFGLLSWIGWCFQCWLHKHRHGKESTGGSSVWVCLNTEDQAAECINTVSVPLSLSHTTWQKGCPFSSGSIRKASPVQVIAPHRDKQLHSVQVSVNSLFSLLRCAPPLPNLHGATLH